MQRLKQRLAWILVVLLGGFLAGAATAQTATPTSTPTQTPTHTPTIVEGYRGSTADNSAVVRIAFTLDLTSCADGTSCVTSVPWDGCLPGDLVKLDRPTSWTTTSAWITGERCSSNNVLEFTVTNESGGAFNPSSLEYTGLWWARKALAQGAETPVLSRPTPTP